MELFLDEFDYQTLAYDIRINHYNFGRMVTLAICDDRHLPLHVSYLSLWGYPFYWLLWKPCGSGPVRPISNATKFWMKLFAINFAIGMPTGLILEFQFSTNWSILLVCRGYFRSSSGHRRFVRFLSRSHFLRRHVLRLEQGKPSFSSGFHLDGIHRFQHFRFVDPRVSSNTWMQNPVGMEFNPMTARNEMSDFWAVLLSPTAPWVKFFHTVTSAYTLSACFVVGVSAWFILKKRHFEFARKSILLASVFGFLSIIATIFTGDISARMLPVPNR